MPSATTRYTRETSQDLELAYPDEEEPFKTKSGRKEDQSTADQSSRRSDSPDPANMLSERPAKRRRKSSYSSQPPLGKIKNYIDLTVHDDLVSEPQATQLVPTPVPRQSPPRQSRPIQAPSGDLEQQIHELRSHLKKSHHDNRKLSHELRQSHSLQTAQAEQLRLQNEKLAAIQSLLDTRTAELQEAQLFLATADVQSGNDCKRLVDMLNIEIQQTAAVIADAALVKRGHVEELAVKEGEKHLERSDLVRPCAGLAIECLQACRSREDPSTMIQLVLQAVLTQMCGSAITVWSWEPPTGDVLQAVYDGLRLKGNVHTNIKTFSTLIPTRTGTPNAVTGRWRALALSQTKSVSLAQQKDLSAVVSNHMISVLLAAGWSRSRDSEIERMCRDRAAIVIQRTLDVDQAIHQGVTSVRMNVCTVPSGEYFDANAMEDPDTEIAQANGEPVAFSLALGLTQVQDGREIKTYLLKPRVMLQATVVEIIE